MPIDTQISSFPIPSEIWFEGYDGLPNLPPLYLPARDALAIERRSVKGVNLRNEMRRYTLCCERIQGIVQDLSQKPGVLPKPVVWPTHDREDTPVPGARAYLALMGLMGLWMSRFLSKLPPEQLKLLYPRISALFFPPEDAARHLEFLELAAQHPALPRLFERASRDATLEGSPFSVSEAQCKRAFHMRHELVRHVASNDCGLVDVIEVV